MTTNPPELLLITGPSGVGKGTLVAQLIDTHPDTYRVVISDTTRPPRSNDRPGETYYFSDKEEFVQRQEAGEYLETNQVHDNYYGTSRQRVEEIARAGLIPVLEIDWQGARDVCEQIANACWVLVLPPSLAVLRQRLESRATDSAEVIERRLAVATQEIRDATPTDLVINDDLAKAVADIHAAVMREPSHPERSGHARGVYELFHSGGASS